MDGYNTQPKCDVHNYMTTKCVCVCVCVCLSVCVAWCGNIEPTAGHFDLHVF